LPDSKSGLQGFHFHEGFGLGVASAATQIEGGGVEHSWTDWYRKGKIKDGSDPARANDHYRLWREDAALMRDLGIRHYRMGLEWARIEKQEGEFDGEAIAHYRDEILLLRKYGIRPLVTLHHFTNPCWFEDKGAFLVKDNIPCFLRFVERITGEFGDAVDEYITINEPNVYGTHSYMMGLWPPGHRSLGETLRVFANLAAAHIAAYTLIHRLRGPGVKVSFAHHLRVFSPENPKNPKHRFFAPLASYLFQDALTNAMCRGRFSWAIRNSGIPGIAPRGYPRGRYCDFLAINYYTRSTVRGLADGVAPGVPVNDLGWEIYPRGIVQCAEEMYRICPVPVYITENGTCDTDDRFRARYITEHLAEIAKSSLPFERYYHWCFCDNFEWIEGEAARFGIVHVDYETQKRTVKESGKFYSDIIKNNGVTEAACLHYATAQQYPQGGK
jgi:beta-glucosidase